jgi:hypothetical protein
MSGINITLSGRYIKYSEETSHYLEETPHCLEETTRLIRDIILSFETPQCPKEISQSPEKYNTVLQRNCIA